MELNSKSVKERFLKNPENSAHFQITHESKKKSKGKLKI